MVRGILTYPDPVLRQVSVPVENGTWVPTQGYENLTAVISDMTAAMRSTGGAGLAAIQIGVPLRLFIIDQGALLPLVVINPEIELGAEVTTATEGCLSFPGVPAVVTRPSRCKLSFRDANWNWCVVEAEGFLARAFQHEYDHLDGRLLIDRIGPMKRDIIKRKMRQR